MAKQDPEPRSEDARAADRQRTVSRRSLLTDELSSASLRMARQLPTFAPLLRLAMKESTARRDERLVREIWQLLLRRAPEPQESAASLELLRGARTVEEKGDALADVLWALCHTAEFEELAPENEALI